MIIMKIVILIVVIIMIIIIIIIIIIITIMIIIIIIIIMIARMSHAPWPGSSIRSLSSPAAGSDNHRRAISRFLQRGLRGAAACSS